MGTFLNNHYIFNRICFIHFHEWISAPDYFNLSDVAPVFLLITLIGQPFRCNFQAFPHIFFYKICCSLGLNFTFLLAYSC